MIEIRELTKVTEASLLEIGSLLPQLHLERSAEDKHLVLREEIECMVDSTQNVLVVAEDAGRIVGMASLYILPKFGRRTGTVEDVVVDSEYRGQHLGERIMQRLIECAKMRGVHTLQLTSRSDRAAAQRLYTKLGFEKKETDVFRLQL